MQSLKIGLDISMAFANYQEAFDGCFLPLLDACMWCELWFASRAGFYVVAFIF
jgi:hypothetical protein